MHVVKVSEERVAGMVVYVYYFFLRSRITSYNVCYTKLLRKSIKILSDEKGQNISMRRITVSTSGVIPGIEALMEEKLPVELAISLHAITDEKRNHLIPINKKYPLEDLYTTLKEYQKVTNRRISYNFV